MKRKTKKPSRSHGIKPKKGEAKGATDAVEDEPTPAEKVEGNRGAEAAEEAETGETEINTLKSQLRDAEDRHLRLFAEFENYRRRTREDVSRARLAGVAEFIEKLAPVLHDLERAVEACSGENDREAVIDGLRLVSTAVGELLGRFGVDVIDPTDGGFDERFMEAFAMVPSETVEAGAIVQVVEKGYRMGERLIRPARVLISSGPPKEAASSDDEVEDGNQSATHAGDVE